MVDDFSRRVWVHILKNKSDTFEKFKEWHTLIGNQVGTKLKILRTNNGLEFLSEQFDKFCRKQDIQRHRTVEDSPKQNGLATCMNRTILERVRSMLLAAGLPKSFGDLEWETGRLLQVEGFRSFGFCACQAGQARC